jgi:serine/threonine protein kinase
VHRDHPNLLTIHHVGQTGDHLFYVMDLADNLRGPAVCEPSGYEAATLERRLADGPLPPEECVRCARQLLEGLASLHQAGMIHCDVKPANCLFVDGQLKLADFGLLTEANPQVSRIGTHKSMPPDGHMDVER